MEERERENRTSMMLPDSPSCHPRKSHPPNSLDGDPNSAGDFASYHQPPTGRPLAFERPDASAPATRSTGFWRPVHSSDVQQTPIAQNDSRLSQRRAASSLKLASNSVIDAELPRKYRLNKLSFSRDSHLWRTPDEPSLHQILEQERNAWLAHSPTDPCTFLDVTNRETRVSHSLPASPQPADQKVKLHQRCRSNQGSPVGSPLKRKSCFQEGSMNEGSRAVASTWDTFHSEHKPVHGDSQSDMSDAEGTPRAQATSRASTSSSIDINEFKPLPATPSTFKSTMRRLGQKVINTKPLHTSEYVPVSTKSEKKQRRGLKRSLSTWKIFSNSASDVEDSSNLTSEDESQGGKTRYSSRTIKPKKSSTNNASSQKEVLDERKRKAEIAYSEQFGTSRKKQKQNCDYDDRDESVSDWDEPSDSTNSRRKGLHTSSTIRAMRSVLRRPTDNPEIFSHRQECAVQSSVPPAPGSHPTSSHHNRSQSHDSNRSLDSDTDRLKKQSRDELEKENQRLRMILRGKEAQKPMRRRARHSRESPTPEPCPGEMSQAAVATNKSEQGNENMLTATPAEPTQPKTKDPRKSPSLSAVNVQKSATVRRSQHDFIIPNDIPPVPPLPVSLQQHKALSTISGNTRPPRETATIKRRGPMCQPFDQNALPRPLSMVLEGTEGENDDEQKSRKQGGQLDGATDDEKERGKGHGAEVQSSRDHGSTTQDWDWPEDVF